MICVRIWNKVDSIAVTCLIALVVVNRAFFYFLFNNGKDNAIKAKIPINKNIPGTPISLLSIGEIINDNANVKPIDAPIIAIPLVLLLSLVKSDKKAVSTAEIAPEP